MFLFDNNFKIELALNKDLFLERLIKVTKIPNELSNDDFSNRRKLFTGKVNQNQFEIIRNINSIRNSFKIIGNISENNGKTVITYKIKGNKLLLLFIIAYTLLCLILLSLNLFLDWYDIKSTIGYSIFLVIGLINLSGLIYYYRRHNRQFIENLKELSI